MSSVHIVLLSILVGFLSSLPTGPTGAFVISRRIEDGLAAMIIAVLSSVLVDHLYIVFVLSDVDFLENLFKQYSVLLLLAAVLIIWIGISRVRKPHPSIEEKPSTPILEKAGNLFGVFILGLTINIFNPIKVLSLISLLATFHLLSDTISVWPIIIGFSIGCLGLWTLAGFFLEKSIVYARKKLSFVLVACGVVMIISGILIIGEVLKPLITNTGIVELHT